MEEKETVREPYRMVLEGGQAELVEKKSRFIANVRPGSNPKQRRLRLLMR